MAGETVIAAIDSVMATDGSGPLTLDLFYKMGGDRVARLHDSMRQFHDC